MARVLTSLVVLGSIAVVAFAALPASFDPRVDRPVQLRKCTHPIRNQFVDICGSCWAFAASAVMSDRLCLHTNGTLDVVLSPQWMVDCDRSNSGCSGGTPENVYTALQAFGTVPDSCSTYHFSFAPTNCTRSQCPSMPAGTVPQLYYMDNVYRVAPDEATIMTELLEHGPISALMNVFSDFNGYTGGVYQPAPTATYNTGHFVRMLGWGIDNGTPYWLCANSFGTAWGENGFFRIKRGACAFEVNLVTGMPRLSMAPRPNPTTPPLGASQNSISGHMDLVLDVQTVVLRVGMSTAAACRWEPSGKHWRRFDLFPEGATHPTTVIADYQTNRTYVMTTLFGARRCNYVPAITGSLATVDYLLPASSTFVGFDQMGSENEVKTTVSMWKFDKESGHNRTFSVKVLADGRALPVSMHDKAGQYDWTFTAQTVMSSAARSLFDLSSETCHEVVDDMSAGISPPIRAFMDALTVGVGCNAPEPTPPATESSPATPSAKQSSDDYVDTSSSDRPKLTLAAIIAITVVCSVVATAVVTSLLCLLLVKSRKSSSMSATSLNEHLLPGSSASY